MLKAINIRQYWEDSFGEPWVDIIRGFAADGETHQSIANILKVDEGYISRFMARNRIQINAGARPSRELDSSSRKKTAATLRARCGRAPVTWKGDDYTFPELQALSGIPADTIRMRINKLGWSVDRAITRDVMTPREVGRQTRRTTPC